MYQESQGKNTVNHIFGDYVMKTTGNAFFDEKEIIKSNKDDNIEKLFEMIEDYIEQA